MNYQKRNILAGIIVYKPEKNLLNLVQLLLEQNVDVFLFINERNSFSDLLIKNKKINYFNSDMNVGISISLNKIIKIFIQNDYKYLFTFDQDSMIDINFIKLMIDSFNEVYKFDRNIVCYSPRIIDEKYLTKRNYSNYFFKKKYNEKKNYELVNYSITSGSLFTKKSFNYVGNMNEKLFIDGVDIDWCQRALMKGFKVYKSKNILMKHKIGKKFISIFGIRKSYHDDNLRVYYIIRNSIFLILNGCNTKIWKFFETIKTFIRLFAYTILSTKKLHTIMIIFFALKDAFLKNMGKMKYINH